METLNQLQLLAVLAIPVIFAITVHEAAHGYAARHFGDNTAAMMGRITLNPVSFNLHLMLHELEHMFSLRAQNKHLDLHVEQPVGEPRFVVDERLGPWSRTEKAAAKKMTNRSCAA